MAWEAASNVERKDGATGTTYKLHHDGQELRVRIRTDREQVEFWTTGDWAISRYQSDAKGGAGVHIVPR